MEEFDVKGGTMSDTDRANIMRELLLDAQKQAKSDPEVIINVSRAMAQAIRMISRGMADDMKVLGVSDGWTDSVVLEMFQHLLVSHILAMMERVDRDTGEPVKSDDAMRNIGFEIRDKIVTAFTDAMETHVKKYRGVVWDQRNDEANKKEQEDADTTS